MYVAGETVVFTFVLKTDSNWANWPVAIDVVMTRPGGSTFYMPGFHLLNQNPDIKGDVNNAKYTPPTETEDGKYIMTIKQSIAGLYRFEIVDPVETKPDRSKYFILRSLIINFVEPTREVDGLIDYPY